MAAATSTGLGQLGLLPLEIRVHIYKMAMISEGHIIRVGLDGELQQGKSDHCRPLERMYTIQDVSASITHEINSLHVPSSVCTFVVHQPRSLEALLRARACRGSWIRNLEIRSEYPMPCTHCMRGRCVNCRNLKEEMAVARMSYSIWGRAFEMLGPRVRQIEINVWMDMWCMEKGLFQMNKQMIKKRVVKLAAMAAKGTEGRARIKVDGGVLVRKEQRFLEEGVEGVVPKTLGWPYETYGGTRATDEQIEAEIAELRERVGDELVNEWMGE